MHSSAEEKYGCGNQAEIVTRELRRCTHGADRNEETIRSSDMKQHKNRLKFYFKSTVL
jgi:hypothetical protein